MSPEWAFIALGSNLNDPVCQIQSAINHIEALSGVKLIATSSLYQTKPLGPEQPEYINAVILIECQLDPLELLSQLLSIEKKQGRVRTIKWGPRVLDCDILMFGKHVCHSSTLTLPHPEMRNRGFVLIPLFELVPDFVFDDGVVLKQLVASFDSNECILLENHRGMQCQ